MKTKTIVEEPIIGYTSDAVTECGGCNLNCERADINIYINDLRNAKVGDTWTTEDFDRCPNSQERWAVSFTVVFKDEGGVALLYRNENPDEPEVELSWIEFGK